MDPSVLPSTQEEVGQATLLGPWLGLVGSEFSGSSCDLTADWPLDREARQGGANLRICPDSQLLGPWTSRIHTV